jgi:hypothetical protein
VAVEVFDFPYTYRHENPFPSDLKIASQVTEGFERVFNRVNRFLVTAI